ncbi:endomembrane protein 70-like protein [Aureococcus anophagefferens]|uniref:Transmembrane 9 superfamily member n=1 Tax=Aureococcus anophagefferens TaxID=44056 RepID=A0ABR1GD19_AURAN
MRVVALLLGALAGSDAFYLPGVAPRTFRYGDKARTRAARAALASAARARRPAPGRAQAATENLGEFLGGDLIENSPFQLFMEQDQFCKVLCQVDLAKSDYIITGVAGGGFPVGYQDHKASYLFNHVNIIVEYHPLDDGSRVKHRFAGDAKWDGKDLAEAPVLETCDKSGPMVYESIAAKQDVSVGTVVFTYGVLWRASNVKWASRWDIYLSMDNQVSDKVHWFSIINSLLIVLFLSVMVAMILVRNLHRDIVRYNRTLTDEEKAEDREESGWKLVHADVFRPPAPANRGSLATAVLVLFVMMGAPAGYTAATLYKTFKGRLWQKCTLYTAFAYPACASSTFLSFDGMLYSYGSTGAVPCSARYFGRLAADEWFTYVLYFGYMILISLGLFALTGACGFFACLWFTKKISPIKVD